MDLKQIADTIRVLSAESVEKANSGHPGLPMGMADFAAVLFMKHLKHCPTSPDWPDRDRFVLSAGHGSTLLYSLLHLAGYGLPMDELKKFRQWGSKTPGHPEYGLTVGVETSTGPLGQGCGNAVGMAIAEAMMAERFNTEKRKIVDHHTYVLCSDGDLMEGISHEAFAIAGHLGLNKLIAFYDCNRITIEGSTELAYSDDVKKRFQSYHWNVMEVDAHDQEAVDKALARAKRKKDAPTLIIGHSRIGKGSPNMEGSHKIHGAPLGAEELAATKKHLGFPEDSDFFVPEAVREAFAERAGAMERKHKSWNRALKAYKKEDSERGEVWDAFINGSVPVDIEAYVPDFSTEKPVATRAASGKVIQEMARAIPNLVGGSADLAPSNKSLMDDEGDIGPGSFSGRNFHFGIREHGMGAILNGLTLHGGFRAYGATFFVFSDYFKPSIRLAALMKLPVIYVLTHDSFYVGEDGPTHEPVEHTMTLRLIPGMTVIRPADATETAAAWVAALENTSGPTAILLTRHNIPVIDRTKYPPASRLEQGAYVMWQSGEGDPEMMLLATGSEVSLAMDAAAELGKKGVNVRVVSMPSWELFEKQPESVKQEVLPESCSKRLAIEAGSTLGWERYVGNKGRVLGIDHFGASAPYKVLAEKYGFTTDNVVRIVEDMLRAEP